MTDEELKKHKQASQKYLNSSSTTSSSSSTVSEQDIAARKKASEKYLSATQRYATRDEIENYYKYGPTTLTQGAMNARYGHVLKSQAYMSLSNDDKKMIQLNNQVNAYKKAKTALREIGSQEKGRTNIKSESYNKAKKLVDNLEGELKTQYESIFGADANFTNWLGSAAIQGADQFNTGLANTAAMVGNMIPSAINEAYRFLNFGTGTKQWVNQYDPNGKDEEVQGWLTMYESLEKKADDLYAKGNKKEGDYYRQQANEYRDRIGDKYADYLKSTGEYWLIPEGEDPFSEYAQMVNEVSARNQENYQKQLEYQKMISNGSGKGWELAGQAVTGVVQALPYAGLAIMTGGVSLGGEIGAQLSPQTTGVISKVADALTSYGKDPQYWLSFAQEAGNTYKEALDAGADQNVATLTATLVGLINGAIEIGLPGGNGGIQDLPERLLKNGGGTRKAIQEWIESTLSEGKEEILQGVISNLAEKIAYNKDKKWYGAGGVIDPESMVKEGGMGGLVGGILGGGQIMGVNVINQTAQNRIDQANARLGQRYSEQADTIIQNARQMGAETKSYQLASDLLEKGSHTDAEIGELYRAYMGDTGYNQNLRTNTIAAVQQRLTELGETSDTREIAEIIAKSADGQKITKAESQAIENSKYGQRVVNELFNAYRGDYSSNWVRGLVTEDEKAAARIAPELTEEQRTEKIESIEQNRPEHTEEEYRDIDKLAEKYGAQANVFKEAAKAAKGTDIYYFDDAYHTVYQLAKNGLDESTIRKDPKTSWLSPAAFKVAYNVGQNAQTFKSGTRYNPNATLKLNGINYKSLNNKQRASVRALMEIARVTGINIELFDSTMADGTLGNEQGSYVNGKIRIDINAGMLDKSDILNVAMLRTASHELTHYIQQNNKDAYQELKDFVFDKLQVAMFSDGKYKDADTWIRSKMEQLKMADTDENYSKASDEVVADACEMMLKDSTAFETLAKENPSLARRLLDWLKGLIADIKKAFSGVEAASTEAKAMLDSMEELQKKWDAALVGAVQNTQAQEAIDNISSPELQNSLRYNTQYMEKAMQMNSIVPDDVMQAAKTARETIAEKFLDPELQDVLGLPPDVIGNTYIPNGSYDGTEENTTVCVRSMAVDALMDAVAEKLGRPLTVADTIAISQEYWKYTDSPECLYCYVAMDRKAYREYLGSYLKQRDDVIENIKNGMSRDEAYEKFLDGRKDTKQMQRRFSMWLTNYNKGVATITPADLASDANMQAAVERDKSLEVQINDARKYAQSASWAKKRISYRAYNNHILKWAKSRIDNLNKHYGLRMYSFSDYSPAFILENMQMITDAAVRGLKMLAYTKELDFVKIFAPTGMNINISVFGHQQNGMISQDAMQGADWEQAQNLRKKYGNVGITFVATNDEQVEWAMAQDWVDVVIPFHLVRTGAKVADYFGWKNYSGMQADVKSKAWKKGDATSIYPSEHHNDKTAYLDALEKNNLTPRFAQWVDNPNYMKLVNETRRSADETPLVQPVFNTDAALKSIETMRKRGGYYVPIGGTEEEMHDIAAEIAGGIDNTQYSTRVTPQQDEEYLALAKDPKKNEALLREMVEQAARANKYISPLLYHGSKSFGFTIFEKTGKKDGYFFTDRLETASTYSGKEKVTSVNTRVRADKEGYRRGNYAAYLDTNNYLEVDCKFRNWDDILVATREVEYTDGKFYGLKLTDDLATGWSVPTTTDNIVDFAKEKNYSGVIFKNIKDNSVENPKYRPVVQGGKGQSLGTSNVYVAFNSEQIKSADPVTYDDDGNVIPLSERFNTENEDIRYSRRINSVVNTAIQNKGKIDEPYNQAQVSPVPTRVADMVLTASDGAIDIKNKMIAISGDEVYHEYDRHSNPDIEQGRGQIALTPATISDAIEGIYNPDMVECIYGDTNNKIQRKSFAYAKKIGTNYIVVEAVGGKNNPNVVPIMILNFTDKKWNNWMASGKSLAELIFENDPKRLADVKDKQKNKNNRVFAAGFSAQDTGKALHPHSPRLSNANVAQTTQEVNTQDESQYQLREQGLSAREILSTALTDVAQTEDERKRLVSYQRVVKALDERQARLDDVRQEIHSIMFTAGSDRSNLKALEAEKADLEKTLNRWDKRLMSLQNTAPLRAVLERERARVRKQTREEIMENVRDKRETSAVRKSIKNLMEKWNSKLQSDTPARNIPAPFKQAIAELSQAMDLTSGRPLSEKAVDKLNKLKSVYDLVMNDDDFKVYQNPIVKMYVDNAVSIINNTPLRQMGREQLEALYDAMKCINSTMFEANKLRDKAYRRDLAETGRAMITDTTEAIAPKWKFWRDYETWQLTPRRFFAMLGGWKKGSAWEQVADSFQEGTRRALRVERDFYNMFRQFTEAPEIDRLTKPNKLIDIGLVGRDGKPVKITRGMMLSIYMHLLSEDNRRALLYGGLNVPVLAEYYGQKIAESYTTGHENVVGILEDMTKLSEQIYQLSTDKSLTDEEKQQKIEEIGKKQDQLEAEGYDRLDALKNRIYNEMTDFEKKLTETATAWNDGKSQNYINEVTMEQYQIKRAKVKNYWRIHRDTSFVQTDFESVAKNMNLANVGWLKDRVKSAAPVLLTDFVYEMDNNVKSLATFYGYAIAQADFNKLYNYKIPGVNKSVQDEVKQKYGGGKKSFGVTADQYVENFIGDVVGSRLKPDTSIWAAVRRNLPRATLTLNPRVALSQIASVPTAAAEVGWGNMAKGFFRGLPTAFNKNAKEELMQKDEYFFQRYRGDGSMREFADMKSGNNIIDKLWNKADKLTKHALLNWCQNFDVFATATMWSMAEEWVKSNTNLTGEAFEAAVKQKYDDIITNTQPNYTKTERSDLLRDTREAYKFLTMYKTQSNQNFNILKEANARLRKTASDYKNGKNGVTKADLNEARKRFANAYSAVLLGGTLAFVALRALANALLGHMNDYRDDDDEITKASVLNGITVASLQSMANMFVLGSEVEALVEKSITGKKYYGLEDTALASANNVLKQLQALAVAYATGETDDIGPKWAKLTQNAAQIVGLPYSSVKTFIEAGKTWAKDIERGTFGSFEGAVERSNKVNYNRLYKALEDGNTAKADSIREEIHRNSPDIEDNTIDSGLRNVIKGMWEDGVISSSEAVDKLVEYTGKDKDTAYWDVQKWSNKANAEEDEKYTDSNYYRLWQVIDNDGDADAAMSELLEHGKDANQVATDIRGHIKDEFVAGTLTEKEAADKLYRYGTHKDNGKQVKYTVQEANEIVAEWSAKQKLGWDYDDKENLYKNGEISKSELKQAMISIGGYTNEKADEKITVYDWQNEGYDDITYASIKEYNGGPKSAGVSHAIWYKYWLAEKSTQADYKANGDTIPYSKMIKVFQYIGNLNITNDQKYALAKTYTDSDANIAKYKTW